MRKLFVTLCLFAACLRADSAPPWQDLGSSASQRFDNIKKAWVPMRVQWTYRKVEDVLYFSLAGVKGGQGLNARLDPKLLPHYQDWVAQRQAKGGAAWKALKPLLGELEKGTLVALCPKLPLPGHGRAKIEIGIRENGHFKRYATVTCAIADYGPADSFFQPMEPEFATTRASLAYEALFPIAHQQLKTAILR